MFKFILPAIIFFSGCATNLPDQVVEKQSEPEKISKVELGKTPDGTFDFPTLYWATPLGVAENDWKAVFGGTVIKVENESEILGSDFRRKFVSGAVKIEKIFLNLPDTTEIGVNSIVGSEDFNGLKKGDKVIIFITGEYEGSYVRTEIAGTNSRLGFKLKDWNEPIVNALEKVAPCGKTRTAWIEGHPEDFRAKIHDCSKDERNKIILDDPQIAEIWKRYDPTGFQYIIESKEAAENADDFDQ